MKSVLVFGVAFLAIAAAYPKPAEVVSKDDESKDTDVEFVRVPLSRAQPSGSFAFGGIPNVFGPPRALDQDPFFSVSPWGAGADEVVPGDDFVTQMQEMLREMRRQLTALANHAHKDHGIGGEDGSVGTRIGDDELPKNQTTSTTKVIDGHKVTVNETTYTSGNEDVGAVFRIKIVAVEPNDDGPTEGGETEDKPVEPTSGAPDLENEPSNNKSELEEDHETNEIPKSQSEKVLRYVWSPEFDPSVNEIEQQEVDTDKKLTPTKNEVFHDLSDDTKVNDFLSDQAESQGLVMVDPDAELIDTNADSYYRYDTEPQHAQRFTK